MQQPWSYSGCAVFPSQAMVKSLLRNPQPVNHILVEGRLNGSLCRQQGGTLNVISAAWRLQQSGKLCVQRHWKGIHEDATIAQCQYNIVRGNTSNRQGRIYKIGALKILVLPKLAWPPRPSNFGTLVD